MATDERYQGWANRETWAVALHINNDQGWQESVHEALRAATDEINDVSFPELGEDHVTRARARNAGEIVRENVERVVCFDFGREDDTMPSNLSSDLVGRSLDRVDWEELGAAFLADIAELDAFEAGERS